MKSSAPSAVFCEQSASLPRQAQLTHGGLAVDFLFLAAAQTLFRTLDHPVEQLGRFVRIVGEIVVEGIAQRVFDDALASTVASLSLVWPTNSGSRMKTESMPTAEIITSSVVICCARLFCVSSA